MEMKPSKGTKQVSAAAQESRTGREPAYIESAAHVVAMGWRDALCGGFLYGRNGREIRQLARLESSTQAGFLETGC
ncbi:hypothetical protein ACLOJK_011052 [Asimina triloba]